MDAEWDSKTGRFLGLGFCSDSKTVYFSEPITDAIRLILETKVIRMHNGASDMAVFEKLGIKIDPSRVRDTMHMSYTLDTERGKHNLKDLCQAFFNASWASYDDMTTVEATEFVLRRGKPVEKRVKKRITLADLPTLEVAEYCGCDTLHTFKLGELLEPKIAECNKRVLKEIDMPLSIVLRESEEVGIMTDVPKLQKLKEQFLEEAKKREEIAKRHLGDINLRSPKQVLLALQSTVDGRIASTNEKALQRFHLSKPVSALLDYREVFKLLSTYVEPLLENPSSPVIRPHFGQSVTATCRLNCSKPNVQNIPSHSAFGKLIREVFIARPGMLLINADLSQADLRMLAHWSREASWVETFQSGGDIHALTAKEVGVPRQVAKTLNLILANSGGVYRIAEALEIPVDDARPIAKKLRQKFKGIYEWSERLASGARIKGGITTIVGRFIPCPQREGVEFNQWSRDTVSKKIQGSTADLSRLAMTQVYAAGIRPILINEHDSIVTESRNAEEDAIRLKEIMENCLQRYGVQPLVPIRADVHIGPNWRVAKG